MWSYRIIIAILLTSAMMFLNAAFFCEVSYAYERESDTEIERRLSRKSYDYIRPPRQRRTRRYFIYKDPETAAILSATVPGLGQLYANRPDKGLTFFITDLTLLATAVWSYGRADYYDDYADRYDMFYDKYSNSLINYKEGYNKARGYATVGTMFLLGGVGIYVWNVFDAAETANQYNKKLVFDIKSTNTGNYLALSMRF